MSAKSNGVTANARVPGLTLRACFASLLGMLLAGMYTQYSAVLLTESYFIAEAALPVPAMIVLVFLVLLVGSLAAAFRFRLLTRPEMVCVAFSMMMAVPLMTQGFWHRFLGITSAPFRNASFDYVDAFHDNLWPHGPNLVASDFQMLLDGGETESPPASISLGGTIDWQLIDYGRKRTARLPVIVNEQEHADGYIEFTIPVDPGVRRAIEPGNPHLVTILARGEDFDLSSEIYGHVFVDGASSPNTLFTERSANRRTYLHPTGFVRIGAYGSVLAEDSESQIVIRFGLRGRGRVAFADPKVMSVAALEGAFQGRRVIRESEYLALPSGQRPAGVVIRPDNLFSPRGLTYLLKGYIPLREWIRPAVLWSSYVLLLCAAFFAVNVIMRRKWADSERYPMPNSRLPMAMIGADDDEHAAPFGRVWRNRYMWSGLILALVFGALKGWHAFNPRIPDLTLEFFLGDYVTDPMWRGMFDVSFVLSLFIVSIAIFFELNVLLSIVLGYWFCRVIYVFGYVTDVQVNAGFPWRHEQTIGAYIGYFLIVLILSRRHLTRVFREALQGIPRGEGEALSSRSALLLLLFSYVGIMIWARFTGATTSSMVLMFAFLVMVGFISAKIRAECGTPFGYFTPYNSMIFVTLCGGMTVFGPEGLLVSLVLSGFLTVTVFYLIPGMQFEMIEIGRRLRLRPYDIMGTCLLGVLGGLFIGGWVFLSNAYSIGGDNVRFQWGFNGLNWFMNNYRTALNEATASWLREESGAMAGTAGWGRAMMVYGGSTAVLLALGRQFFSGFWFHPIGFILGSTHLNDGANWGSLLVAWAIRALVLKVGGAQAVTRKLQPFFIGVFIGCVICIAAFTLVNGLSVAQGSRNFYHGIP